MLARATRHTSTLPGPVHQSSRKTKLPSINSTSSSFPINVSDSCCSSIRQASPPILPVKQQRCQHPHLAGQRKHHRLAHSQRRFSKARSRSHHVLLFTETRTPDVGLWIRTQSHHHLHAHPAVLQG